MTDERKQATHFQVVNRNWVGFGRAAVHGIVAGILVLGGLSVFPARAQARAQSRITAAIHSGQMQAIQGTVHPKVAQSQDEGQLNGSTTIQGMSLIFRRSAAQEANLKNLLREQQTEGSPMYHQWLKPGQFAARYGVSQSDIAKVAGWLQSEGFKIDTIPASADRIDFSGTAAQVNATFQTQLHHYLLRGQTRWANATELSLPQAIAGMTLGVEHLNTFRPMPHSIRRQVHVARHSTAESLNPHYTPPGQGGSGQNFIAPSDIATIYNVGGLYNNGITGKGQTLAVVGQTDITKYQSDIANFRSLSGLDASNLPMQIVVPGTGTVTSYAGDLEEADIDVEWSGAVAKDATILYVTVGNDQNSSVFDALQYAIQIPLVNNHTQFVPVVSISYGLCEAALAGSQSLLQMESILEEANAQGQTVIAASGDSGSADCDNTGSGSAASHGLAIDYPGSSQYVTAVGGTSFSGDLTDPSKYWNSSSNADNGSAIGYIPETAWNNTSTPTGLTNAGSLSASGGGASALFAKPSWQVGSNVPQDGMRDVPDISLASDPNHDGYVLCTDKTNSAGSLTGTSSCAYPVGANEVPYFDATENGYLYGGTSIASPQIAALITLWNQEAGNTNGVGNVNPLLYLAAQNTPGAFHDVITGSNAVVCKQGSHNCTSNGSGGYVMSCCNAGSGYDEATGLGSVDVAALEAVWPTTSVIAQNPSQPQPTFSMAPNPIKVSLTAGGSATTSLVLTPSSGFTGTITLACSGLPANTTCNFAPASVNVTAGNSNAAQTVKLTLSNSASAQLSSPQPLHRDWPMETMFAGVFGLSMLGIGGKRKFPQRWASRWMALFILAAGLMAVSALTACGAASPRPSSTSPGGNSGSSITSTITITGTSASTSVTDKILLTITS